VTVGQRWGVEVDLTEGGDDERLLAAARKAFGEIDILVLNGPWPDPGRRVQWDQCPAAQPRAVQPRACMLAGYLMALAAEVAADGVTVNPPWRPSR